MNEETKHPGGRPLKFESVEVMQKLIDAYFETAIVGEYTITGLALTLDTTRLTLIQYEGRDEFVNAVKKAKTRIENDYELALRRHGRSGEIFGLKNFGWKDKQEVEHTGDMSNNGGICRASEILREFRGSGQGDPVKGDVQE